MTVNFVAEVSSNHNQDLDRCYQFIETAARTGCTAVKFQLFRLDRLFAPCVLRHSAEHRQRRNWELPIEFLPHLHAKCQEYNISFACTPFHLEAVEKLAPYVTFYKIASYEILRQDLLAACAGTGKPVVLSTGMATLDEIDTAVDTLKQGGCRDITLLHCVSAYPVPPDQCNLAIMETLRQRYGCPVGWSDHSVSPAVIYRAVHRWRASMVEFHLDLDGQGVEYKQGHCWLPSPAGMMIETVCTGSLADGRPKKSIAHSEAADREWRSDPADGLRPLSSTRKKLKNK